MPNSNWTETGSSISLVPKTTTIDGGSDATNVNYLTNTYKIALMQQYAAELAIKTALDSLAVTWGVSSVFYDNAVAGISSGLITAGAPANWATIWPDGTTSGPWFNIQNNLSNLWAQVATQRIGLQSVISNAQAASAEIAAVAQAANDAQTAINEAQWSAVQSAAAFGASESIVPNGGFATGSALGWVADQAASAGAYGTSPQGNVGVTLAANAVSGMASPAFQVFPGKKYKMIFWLYAGAGAQVIYLRVAWAQNPAPNITDAVRTGYLDLIAAGSVTTSGATYYVYDWTPAAGQNYASMCVYEWEGSTAPVYIGGCFCVPYVQAAYLDAGAVTAASLAAGSVTASAIAAGAVTATSLTVANFDNLIPNPNSEQQAPVGGWPAGAWEAVGLDGANPYSGSMDRCIYLGAGVGWGSAQVSPYIPCGAGDSFYFEAMACEWNGGFTAQIIIYFDDITHADLTYKVSNAVGNAGYTKVSVVATAPPNTAFAKFVIEVKGTANGNSTRGFFDNLYARRMADGALIVDGAITATKIAAGAISADMITAGTLNASNVQVINLNADHITGGTLNGNSVNVINLNASKITTGTLSAGKVLFGDGTALTGAARVLTATATISSTVTITSLTPTPLPSFGWSLIAASTAASTNDVFDISASVCFTAVTGTTAVFSICVIVDGNTSNPLSPMYQNALGSSSLIVMPYFASITGLSGAAHTIQICATYADPHGVYVYNGGSGGYLGAAIIKRTW